MLVLALGAGPAGARGSAPVDLAVDTPAGSPLEPADVAWEALHGVAVAMASDRGAAGKLVLRIPRQFEARPDGDPHPDRAIPPIETEQSLRGRAADGTAPLQVAQFQVPKRQVPQREADEAFAPRYEGRPVIQALKYQYSFGSESEVDYRRDPDLNRRVQDNTSIVVPQVNGLVVYRPVDWFATTLEMILDQEFAVQEEPVVVLPDGGLQFAPKRKPSFLVDQAFVTFRGITDPFEFDFGRRNFEDDRHWLYDTSMDVFRTLLKLGHYRFEASVGRQVLWDLDLLQTQVKDRTNTYMLYGEYRGIEDHKLAAYGIRRFDYSQQDGRPLHLGARMLGNPSDSFKYWADLALVRGRDELNQKFRAHGLDVGATYQFRTLPWSPSVTLSYAYGSGDGNASDNENKEFRQTGLESNEFRWAGVAKFKYYGEALDPQLSNLRIFTLGIGFRPAPTVTVDLVYHRYRLNDLADSIRGSALTAVMNQDDTQLSREVGRGFDVVVGIRNLFGVRRLGVDIRAGWFYPGKAFRIEEGDPDDPTFRGANKGIGVVAKIWY